MHPDFVRELPVGGGCFLSGHITITGGKRGYGGLKPLPLRKLLCDLPPAQAPQKFRYGLQTRPAHRVCLREGTSTMARINPQVAH